MPVYAHSKSGCPPERWHLLEEHLRVVGERAKEFAGKWNAGDWGFYAGLWHDLGKCAADWQEYLISTGATDEDASVVDGEGGRRRRGPDHSTAGAIHARSTIANPHAARILEFAIAAHHAGLANREDLDARLTDAAKRERYAQVLSRANRAITSVAELPRFPPFFPGGGDTNRQRRRYEFLVRMIFSTLVDADYLDTERFMEEGGKRSTERERWPSVGDYRQPLNAAFSRLASNSEASPAVRSARDAVLTWCRSAAGLPQGAFTLTVPTGGGKTLASLAFAIEHAIRHSLDRVIIVLPFLSIVDQTADVLRGIFEPHFGERVLVEHHSNVDAPRDTFRNRLASENWNAPLIITTQVQLFESLFASRPSHCRKLHNIAKSVVILDEAQSLPVGLLAPIVEGLQELTEHYRTSVLLTTATQPSLHTRSLGVSTFEGLDPAPHEIVPADRISALFESLRRVRVRWPKPGAETSWESLASATASTPQALVIVHRRKDAVALWREVARVNSEEPIHLSALMCAAHRRKVLARIRRRIERGDECRVISTQLIEAGVDIDFPVVFRAMAGLESLAQAAGRCNREGRRKYGELHVYRAPTEPVGSLRHHRDIAEIMLNANPDLDLFSPDTFRTYFDRLYVARDRDENAVQPLRQSLQFRDTACAFRMIEEIAVPVFVPYGREGREAIDLLRSSPPTRDRFRALQPFGVNLYPNDVKALQARGAIELLHDSIWALISTRDYDERLGLVVERETFELLTV